MIGFGLSTSLRPGVGAALPAPLPSGATLVAAFDARLRPPAASGGVVTSWTSLDGAYTASPGGASTRPTWNAYSAAFGGPSITFDGSDDFLKATGLAVGVNTLVLMTLRQVSWTEGDYVFGGTGVTATLYQHSASPALYLYNGGVGDNSAGCPVGAAAQPKRVWAYFKGAASEIKAGSVRTSAGVDSGAGSGADFCIGAATAGTNNASIELDAVYLYAATSMPSMTGIDAWITARNGAAFLT